MKIYGCIIVKDDSEYEKLIKCLTSCGPYLDKIYLTTTGTETTKIKTIKGVEHSYFDWCDDFSAARNFNFSQVPADADYIFWIDADDILLGGETLRDVAKTAKDMGKDVVFLTYWYGCGFAGEPSEETLTEVQLVQMRERLLRPGVTTWKKRLHETPIPVPGVKNNYSSYAYDPKDRPLVVMHTSVEADLPEKMQRNQHILELELADERAQGSADPRTLLYLMKIYAEKDERDLWSKVIPMGEEYLQKSGWDEERGTCYEMMGIALGKLGDERRAAECFHKAISEWPHQILFYIRLAHAYYNVENYKACKHWMDIASQMDIEKRYTSGATNIKAMKVMFAQLLLKYHYNVEKDTKKALEAARLLAVEQPDAANTQQVQFLEDVNDLNEACKNIDHLAKYLDSIGAEEVIPNVLEQLPEAITRQPFALRLRQRYTTPKHWAKNEICYFANFGGAHFEPWDATSLETGIGGSETAVIELAKQWTKMGYKVTVYGDPKQAGDHDGVTYLPWFHFNRADNFNIFIQWRGWQLAGKVKAKKFFVDLHDIFSDIDVFPEQLQHIDKFMVKSQYHRTLAPSLPDDKFLIISNGIQL